MSQLKDKYQITVLAETDGAFNAEPISKDGIKVSIAGTDITPLEVH